MPNIQLTRVLGVAALLGVGACSKESFNILNTNAPTVDQLAGRAALARTAIGIASGLTIDVAGEAGFYVIFGREGWNLLGNDPRTTGEALKGPLDPGGVGGVAWAGKYQTMRTVNTYLTAIDAATDLTAAEKSASKGYAQTMKAQLFHRAITRDGKLGIPIRVEVGLDDPPAKFETEAATYAYLVALLDSAKASLAAGGAAFPFNIPAGLEPFATPADFIKLNRGLLAKVLIHQATFAACGAPCFTAALTALGESFITTTGLPGTLTLGAYYAYSTASGEPTNPIAEPLTRDRYYVHPSYETDAQLTATGAKDLRFTNKVRLGTPKALTQPSGTLSGTLKPIMYNTNTPTSSDADLGADIPWLKNEELILLRAEANIGLNNLTPAVADLDLVRINSGGLPAYSGPVTQAGLLTELIYNRRYSLMWEQGTRWLDARRYNRTNTLPIDRPGEVVFQNVTVPASECDARALARPCDPLAAGK